MRPRQDVIVSLFRQDVEARRSERGSTIRKVRFTYRGSCLVLLLMATFWMAGCATGGAPRFADRPTVTAVADARPIPVPDRPAFNKRAYFYNVLIRHPAVAGLEVGYNVPAGDINSMDEVPASTWFTPRLAYRDVTPDELLHGVEVVGPPHPPVTVIDAKPEGNPGFIVLDARGEKYVIKFDPPEFPGIETTTDMIVDRFFWGFGYNVPEDYVFMFRRDEDMRIDPDGELSRGDVDEVLGLVAPPLDGVYRSTASLWVSGTYVGTTADQGVRKDDPNDRIPHEDRRTMRALRIFGAFLNHSDMRVDNAGDFYQGEPGEGFVRHYLIDFGEALGGHGAEHGYLWDGYEHLFSFSEAGHNFVRLGLEVDDWERIEYTPWKSVGAFEATHFRPEGWKEVYPFEPIRRSRPEDDYWATRIVGALTPEHIRTVVEAAGYPEPEAAEYVIDTLLRRREKVLAYFLEQVSPMDPIEFDGGTLRLRDMTIALLGWDDTGTSYEVRFHDGSDNEIAPAEALYGHDGVVEISVPLLLFLEHSGGYVRVDVRVHRGSHAAPRVAQFHLRSRGTDPPRLVGVVH